MKKVQTVSLESVKTMVRGGKGAVRNHGGWCIFVDSKGGHFYVVDDEDQRPVPYQKISSLSRAGSYEGAPIILSS